MCCRKAPQQDLCRESLHTHVSPCAAPFSLCHVGWCKPSAPQKSPPLWNGRCSRADWWRRWCQFIMIGIDVWFKVKITQLNHSSVGTHGIKIRSGSGGEQRLINLCMDGSDGTSFALSFYISTCVQPSCLDLSQRPENTGIFYIFRMTFLASHLSWT